MPSAQPFDLLAPTYDRDFTRSPIAAYLRERVHERLALHFPRGAHVIELGCGTGEDALRLGERGVRVTATDGSIGMLEQARSKGGEHPLLAFELLDLARLDTASTALNGPFDGAFANFGPLNCLDDRRLLAGWLAARMKPGGIAAFGMMSPLCLWEILWHGAHANFRTATRRLRSRAQFRLSEAAAPISVTYPSIARLTRDFAPLFRRVHIEPLGIFLPPTDVYGALERRPRLLQMLVSLEQRFGKARTLALLADHYWIEFERLA